MEPSGPVQACNGIALPLQIIHINVAMLQNTKNLPQLH